MKKIKDIKVITDIENFIENDKDKKLINDNERLTIENKEHCLGKVLYDNINDDTILKHFFFYRDASQTISITVLSINFINCTFDDISIDEIQDNLLTPLGIFLAGVEEKDLISSIKRSYININFCNCLFDNCIIKHIDRLVFT